MGYKRINQIYFMADTIEDLPNITGTLRMGLNVLLLPNLVNINIQVMGSGLNKPPFLLALKI